MKNLKKYQLGISNNKKYFVEGGKPFFWLADTAWFMLQRLNEDEIRLYFRNRIEKGFNVIQTTLIHVAPDKEKPLAPGYKDPNQSEYWDFVDRVIEIAAEMGLYMGLLPAWGAIVKEGKLTLDNIEKYSRFLGERYQKYINIIWILGGDIRGTEGFELFCKEGEILKSYNPERLITYHPFGRTSSSMWFHNEYWLDFNTYQSGHRRYDQEQLGEWDDNVVRESFFGEDNWKYVLRDHDNPLIKPTLDSEPSYEGIPKGLHNPRNGYWEDWDVRRYAYWSVFSGAAGHSYGNNAIMQFHCDMNVQGFYGVREVWQEALHHPGSGQLNHLKNLMLSVDFQNGKPADELLLFGQKERYHRISVFAGDHFILCYDYCGDEFMLDLSSYSNKNMDTYWFNPQDGTYSYISTIIHQMDYKFSPITRKNYINDWVLVMKEA